MVKTIPKIQKLSAAIQLMLIRPTVGAEMSEANIATLMSAVTTIPTRILNRSPTNMLIERMSLVAFIDKCFSLFE